MTTELSALDFNVSMINFYALLEWYPKEFSYGDINETGNYKANGIFWKTINVSWEKQQEKSLGF